MATLGGNLFAETPYGDLAVALLALDAQAMVLQGYGAARAIPLEELFNARERGGLGLVTAVQFNRPQNRPISVSASQPREAEGIAVLSIAAHLPLSGGRVSNGRVAYGAMAATPIRARAVERVLEGKLIDAAAVAAAKAVAAEGTRPATDSIASDWYRREVLPVHLGGCSPASLEESQDAQGSDPVPFERSERAAFADSADNLLTVLRRGLNDFGPKYGCGQARAASVRFG